MLGEREVAGGIGAEWAQVAEPPDLSLNRRADSSDQIAKRTRQEHPSCPGQILATTSTAYGKERRRWLALLTLHFFLDAGEEASRPRRDPGHACIQTLPKALKVLLAQLLRCGGQCNDPAEDLTENWVAVIQPV